MYGNSTDYAAGWCQNYTFKNGRNGYLGSCGEWWQLNRNRSEIKEYMSLVGGDTILNPEWYWTSTQYDLSRAWNYYMTGSLAYADDKGDYSKVRAFAKID